MDSPYTWRRVKTVDLERVVNYLIAQRINFEARPGGKTEKTWEMRTSKPYRAAFDLYLETNSLNASYRAGLTGRPATRD